MKSKTQGTPLAKVPLHATDWERVSERQLYLTREQAFRAADRIATKRKLTRARARRELRNWFASVATGAQVTLADSYVGKLVRLLHIDAALADAGKLLHATR